MSLSYMIIESACVRVKLRTYAMLNTIYVFLIIDNQSWEWMSLTIKEKSSTTKWVYQQNFP